MTVRHHLQRLGRQIEDGNSIVPTFTVHERQLFTVRRYARSGVIRSVESESSRTAWIADVDLVDLRSAGTIGHEIKLLAVAGPSRLRIDPWIKGHSRGHLTRQVQSVDVQIAILARQGHRHGAHVG